MPVAVHSRGAFRECVEMIDESGVDWSRVVFHCFSEGVAEMNDLTRRGGRGFVHGDDHLQECRQRARGGQCPGAGAADDRDGRAVPRAGAPSRQAERAGVCAPYGGVLCAAFSA